VNSLIVKALSLAFLFLLPGMVQAQHDMGAISINIGLILGLNFLIFLYVFYRCAFLIALLHLFVVVIVFAGYIAFSVKVVGDSPVDGWFFIFLTYLILVVLPVAVAYFLIRKKKRDGGWL